MKIKKLLLGLTIAIFTITSFNISMAGEKKQMTEKQMMEMWMKIASPSENHKHFEKLAGEWEITTTMWEPGKEPQITKGTSSSKLILGGRYLFTKMHGSYAGMPYEGIGIAGYDNLNKVFNTIWIDNFGTSFYLTKGHLDKTGKIMTETGEWDDFSTGHPMKIKNITTIINKDELKYEMYHTQYGKKEIKAMEIVYKRKK